ncbi:MAG TPA: RND transporter, partial [Cryomorphaceae bacterium]|nr:RND transporter [Cryomorphaceae bacterium]
ITATAFVDDFQDLVVSSGELIAKNSEDILGPNGLQRYGLYNVQISEIIPEGSYVEEGDFVCSLDKSDINTKINDVMVELEKAESQYTQTKLDTSLTLREKRNELANLAFQIKQKGIELEQSAYEPPATIQRLKLDLEKLEQDLEQAKENYSIKKRQSTAKMVEAGAELQQKKNRLEKLQELMGQFTIKAPKTGMVIYKREWDGDKRKTGSTISPWDPAVATLPDLSEMLSKTYINEVDIRKVKTGQKVVLGLDAFPDIQLSGTVTKVANVGETRKGADTKVFEVEISVNESDSTYRPGMTTSNQILTNEIPKVLQIPLEAVYASDNVSFVYLKNGVSVTKKEVRLGVANDEFVIIEEGIQEGDEVYLSEPASARTQEIQTLTASASARP